MSGERKHEAMYALFGKTVPKCKSCWHLKQVRPTNRHFYKCELYGISCSAATDWAVNKNGCGLFNEPIDMRMWTPVIDRLKHEPKIKLEVSDENQITLEEVLENVCAF